MLGTIENPNDNHKTRNERLIITKNWIKIISYCDIICYLVIPNRTATDFKMREWLFTIYIRNYDENWEKHERAKNKPEIKWKTVLHSIKDERHEPINNSIKSIQWS